MSFNTENDFPNYTVLPRVDKGYHRESGKSIFLTLTRLLSCPPLSTFPGIKIVGKNSTGHLCFCMSLCHSVASLELCADYALSLIRSERLLIEGRMFKIILSKVPNLAESRPTRTD